MQPRPDAAHDFDFLFGRWTIHHERLTERLVGATSWETFEARHECRPVLCGLGNVDEMVTEWSGGYRGMSVRLFDPAEQRWTIWWASTRGGLLEPPVHGQFADGVGTFYGRDTHSGAPVLVRYLWSDIARDRATWAQAFSTDEGASWETNWWMRFRRA